MLDPLGECLSKSRSGSPRGLRLPGPRVFATGQSITATGGHGYSSIAPTVRDGRVASGPDVIRYCTVSSTGTDACGEEGSGSSTRWSEKALRDEPERIKGPIDAMHRIVISEFSRLQPERFREDLVITKSYAQGGIEVNYEQTWKDGRLRRPYLCP